MEKILYDTLIQKNRSTKKTTVADLHVSRFLFCSFTFGFFFLTGMTLKWVVGLAQIQAFMKKKRCMRLDLLNGELWARLPVLTPVPSQANHSSSRRHQFQTGQTPEEPARIFRLLGWCLETLLRRWHACGTPWSMFQTG